MLPTQKSVPKASIFDVTALMYGPTKIGKTTCCADAEGAIILATEPGHNMVECYKVDINNWTDFLRVCAELRDDPHDFRTVVIDTVDNLYEFCKDYICKREKIENIGDLDYGKGYAMLNNEFQMVLTKLAMLINKKGLKMGLWMISHMKEWEVKTKTGTRTKIGPTLNEKSRKIVLGLVDLVLFADIESGPKGENPRRVVRTKPTYDYEAGDRTGKMAEIIPLKFSEISKEFERAMEKVRAEKAAARAEGREVAHPADKGEIPTTPAGEEKVEGKVEEKAEEKKPEEKKAEPAKPAAQAAKK